MKLISSSDEGGVHVRRRLGGVIGGGFGRSIEWIGVDGCGFGRSIEWIGGVGIGRANGSRPRASRPFTSRRCCGGVGVGVSSDDSDSLSCVPNFTMGT